MKHLRSAVSASVLVACSAISAVGAANQSTATTPTLATVRIVSLDVGTRSLVIRTPEGKEQRVELDDNVAGLQGVKAGDRVIVTLRGQAGAARVTSMVKAAETPAAKATPAPKPPAATDDGADSPAGKAFADKVASLAEQASRIDRLWSSFGSACDVKVSGSYDGAREWVSVWDNQMKADLSTGFCRDLYNQIVGEATSVSQSMASAEDAARSVLLPGTLREISLRHSLDWGGWGRTPPERQKP